MTKTTSEKERLLRDKTRCHPRMIYDRARDFYLVKSPSFPLRLNKSPSNPHHLNLTNVLSSMTITSKRAEKTMAKSLIFPRPYIMGASPGSTKPNYITLLKGMRKEEREENLPIDLSNSLEKMPFSPPTLMELTVSPCPKSSPKFQNSIHPLTESSLPSQTPMPYTVVYSHDWW